MVVTCSGAGAMLICMDAVEVCKAASVTLAVKLAGPDAVGVPDSTPALESDNPAGSDPVLTDQEYGVVPPVAASVTEYGIVTCPLGSGLLVVICSGAGEILICIAAVEVCAAASVTLTVKLAGPDAVGVPDSTPALESVNPLGTAPALTLQV